MDQFNTEIERILKQVYYDPLKSVEHITKRAIVTTEIRYIEYLVDKGLIDRLKNVSGGGKFGIQLTVKGYEVFEKYQSWNDYKIKIIDHEDKILKAKNLGTLYWWVPIAISVIALAISILALLNESNN